MGYIEEPSFPWLPLLHVAFISSMAKSQTEIKSFDALIDTAGNKLLNTQASFKSLCVLAINVTFKSQCQLSLPLTIPYVDLSAV